LGSTDVAETLAIRIIRTAIDRGMWARLQALAE
jgi:hypothetical protein